MLCHRSIAMLVVRHVNVKHLEKRKKRTILQPNLSALKWDPSTSKQHVLNLCTIGNIFFTALPLLLFSQVAKNRK